MTEHEIDLAAALGRCSFLPGSAEKRFCRSMAEIAACSPQKELTLRQRHYMEIMAWRYRRQLPARLQLLSKPLDLPPARKERKSKPQSEMLLFPRIPGAAT